MKCWAKSSTSFSLENMVASGRAKLTITMLQRMVMLTERICASRTPLRARSICRAPKFCPTKVVEAMAMACMGIRMNASSLL